jgi:tetratricopeptide (TPR) repeat protein
VKAKQQQKKRNGGDYLTSRSPAPAPRRIAMTAAYAEEVTRAGNQQYKKGCFEEALRLYDCALVVCSDNAACRGNRAAALTALRRFDEAVKECEDALRIDPSYGRAHKRLASLHIRLFSFPFLRPCR